MTNRILAPQPCGWVFFVVLFFFFGNWHKVQLLTGKAVRSAASQDTHLDKHLETVKDGVSTDNRVNSKENEDQREYVQFQTDGCGSHRWDRGCAESGGFSTSELFGYLGRTQRETESVPFFSSRPAVPFGIGEDRTFTGGIEAPVRDRPERPVPAEEASPVPLRAGATPGRRHSLMRCRVEEVEEVLSHADCS